MWNLFLATAFILVQTNAAPFLCQNATLNVFNLNTWAVSYFDDFPIQEEKGTFPKISEDFEGKTFNLDFGAKPFNLTSAVESYLKFGEEFFRNQGFVSVFKFKSIVRLLKLFIQNNSLLQLLNPALKKKERLNALCDHLNENDFHVVFLQEIWYKHDYEFIKERTGKNYLITKFDPQCGSTNSMTVLECSGLVTLVAKKMVLGAPKHFYLILPEESQTDIASFIDFQLFAQFQLTRKVLIVDVKIANTVIRLINTHLAPFSTSKKQNRQLRLDQAKFICDSAFHGNSWDLAIIGMDMNDTPDSTVYRSFMDCDLSDAYNPVINDFPTSFPPYPPTWTTEGNTWTNINAQPKNLTLDYVMVKQNNGRSGKFKFEHVHVEDLKTPKGQSFSDHNAVSTNITYQIFPESCP